MPRSASSAVAAPPQKASASASPDAAIVDGIRNRRPEALEAAFQQHSGAIHALALRLLCRAPDADEIVRSVFLRLWQEPSWFGDRSGSLRSLLLADGHARCVVLLRSDRARGRPKHRPAPWTAQANRALDAGAALPPSDRQALELAYFGGYSVPEVARLLGEPVSTVTRRIRAGLGALRPDNARPRLTA